MNNNNNYKISNKAIFFGCFLVCFFIISCNKVEQSKEKDIIKKQKSILKSCETKLSNNKNNNDNGLSKNKNIVSADVLQNKLQFFQDSIQKAKLDDNEFSDTSANNFDAALKSQIIDWTPEEWKAVKQFFQANNCTNYISYQFMELIYKLYAQAGKMSNQIIEKICNQLLDIGNCAANKEFGINLMCQIATIQCKIKNYDTSIKISENCFDLYLNENITDHTLATKAGVRMAECYSKLGEFEKIENMVSNWKKSVKNKNIPINEYFTLEYLVAGNYIQPEYGKGEMIKGITLLNELVKKLEKTEGVSKFIRKSIKRDYDNWKNHPAYISAMQNKDDY